MKRLLGILLLAVACNQPGANTVPEDKQGQEPEKKEFTAKLTTLPATGITVSSAILHASYEGLDTEYDPQGVVFRYGTSAESLSQEAEVFEHVSGPSGEFSKALDELTSGQTYYYQATFDAWNPVEKKYTHVSGEVLSFTTDKKALTSAVPEWAELPVLDYTSDGSYKVSTTDSNLYYAWHISPDVKGPGGKLARNYTVCYSAEHHCPVWVAAPRHSMYVGSSGRTDAYGKDPDVPADIQYNSKSTGGGCNKGHMLGSAERTCSKATNQQVFYYTNIAPQLSSGFNTGGGGWNLLEDYVDTQVCADTLYEVLGTYFERYTDGYGKTQTPSTISFGSRNDVHMPTMFYYALLRTKSGNSGKSVKDCSASELKCVAFVRSHVNDLKGQKPSAKELMSIADLERLTGFTFFPNVPNAPKNTFSASDWGL
ncbi:MAG: DNA/RNA non-specific endonuclease [Bacteroidales bacterium]|nr:DNA/RNA non-specific endonuclease [Bacteroidales bacterium]